MILTMIRISKERLEGSVARGIREGAEGGMRGVKHHVLQLLPFYLMKLYLR